MQNDSIVLVLENGFGSVIFNDESVFCGKVREWTISVSADRQTFSVSLQALPVESLGPVTDLQITKEENI